MLIVAIMGLIFNLIQMKILHSGDSHYHLGGEECPGHDHGHGEEAHGGHGGHGHNHDDGHGHGGHGHGHGGCSGHKHEHGKKFDAEVKQELLDNEGTQDHHAHDHAHDHSHGHSHAHAHTEENMLVDAAFLHVLGDMLMSVGVIIAATIIYFFPDLWYFDPICTYLFSVIVMVTTIPIIKNCIKVLMEGAPDKIDIEELRKDIYECN